jgi:hypothetical protein
MVLANLGSVSETCVGSRFHLVGASISFEKNFYRLPFTPPPSLVRRFGPSRGATYHAFLFCGTRTHLVRWEWFSHGGSRFDRFDTMDRNFDRRGRMDVANPTFEEMARH